MRPGKQAALKVEKSGSSLKDEPALQTRGFESRETDFRLLTSRALRE